MKLENFAVTADQMRQIEAKIFAAGMPVAALMEKVAGRIAARIQMILRAEGRRQKESEFFSGCGGWGLAEANVPGIADVRKEAEGKEVFDLQQLPAIGFLVGPGHNGGDALVVARELHFQGFSVVIYCPFAKVKELTDCHLRYARSLNIPCSDKVDVLTNCDLLVDGLFGFGLEREITNPIALAIDQINHLNKPIFSIDIPSGIHTDTGAVLGTAIRATRTLCLGLWKLGLLQDKALEYVGKAELIDFGIPWADVENVLERSSKIHRITRKIALSTLPLPRPPVTHKYKEGHLLLICGSRRYAGGAILTGLGARASGVGMLSIAVPESLKSLLVAQLPEALIIGCPETETGAISQLELPANT
ncbi:NAD(P)H-hydrate epimerase, partial [Candidatus Gracilibacteria bacterium]|nr:NAD(P)H-hydrate epimerase [Candidatus Gracilibacteria bacterium]